MHINVCGSGGSISPARCLQKKFGITSSLGSVDDGGCGWRHNRFKSSWLTKLHEVAARFEWSKWAENASSGDELFKDKRSNKWNFVVSHSCFRLWWRSVEKFHMHFHCVFGKTIFPMTWTVKPQRCKRLQIGWSLEPHNLGSSQISKEEIMHTWWPFKTVYCLFFERNFIIR